MIGSSEMRCVPVCFQCLRLRPRQGSGFRKKTHLPYFGRTDAARRNKLAQSIACGTGRRVRKKKESIQDIVKIKVPLFRTIDFIRS